MIEEEFEEIETFDNLFLEHINNNNINKFYNLLDNYNYEDCYKVCNIKSSIEYFKQYHTYTIPGIVLDLSSYDIFLSLFNIPEINFHSISKFNVIYYKQVTKYTPLYQILSAKNNKIEENCLELCKKILDKGVSLNEYVNIYHNEISYFKNAIDVCKIYKKNNLKELIMYENSI